MSEEEEIVRALQPPPDLDFADLFMRDDDAGAQAWAEALGDRFTEDFTAVFHALSSEPRQGVAGLRQAWLDWMEPWETYRAEIESVRSTSAGRVLVISRDFGRRPGTDTEVELKASAVWTVREGRVARAEFFTDRADAERAAGLHD
jgi:ketosteroid isomerase-like protein